MRLNATRLLFQLSNRCLSSSAYTGRYSSFETISISSAAPHVLHLELNRPENYNTLNKNMFRELNDCFKLINDDQQARVVVISGVGNQFSAGLDWEDLAHYMRRISERKFNSISESSVGPDGRADVARTAKLIRSMLIQFQEAFNSIEKCSKPAISAVHGSCIGAALALLTATDIRYCTKDAFFQVKEVDTGMAPDLGTLQRLPKLATNDSRIRELIYTADKLDAVEAKQIGLVSRVFENYNECLNAAIETSKLIASKSPVAVQGSKVILKYSRDHSIWDGLRVNANWNSVMTQSEDIAKAMEAHLTKKPATFNDL